jgi:acetyl esterase/lipase
MRRAVVLILAVCWSSALPAQVANMPRSVQDLLSEVGPTWGADLDRNIRKTREAYTDVLAQSPRSGVSVVSDLSYGKDPRHKSDLYRREGQTGVPVVAFLHGGAYVRGERNINAQLFSSAGIDFARQGLVAVNATYRLAPSAAWPSGAEDIAALGRTGFARGE